MPNDFLQASYHDQIPELGMKEGHSYLCRSDRTWMASWSGSDSNAENVSRHETSESVSHFDIDREIFRGLVLLCAVYFLNISLCLRRSFHHRHPKRLPFLMRCAASVLVSPQPSADRQWNSLHIGLCSSFYKLNFEWNWAAGSTKDFQGDPNCFFSWRTCGLLNII